MKRIITDELMQEIASHMDADVREWAEHTYSYYENEEILKQYYLRLIYEKGEEKGDEFDWMLWNDFGVDIMEYVTPEEKLDSIDMYENTDKNGTWIGKEA